MHQKINTFLKMFAIELEDLHEDVELLIERYCDEHDHEVISNHVFYENVALMNNELFGIDSFLDEVRQIDPLGFKDTNELIDSLKKRLRERCANKGIAASAYILAERKMNKVLAYVEGHSSRKIVVGAGVDRCFA